MSTCAERTYLESDKNESTQAQNNVKLKNEEMNNIFLVFFTSAHTVT